MAVKARIQIISWVLVIAVIALLFGIWTQHNIHSKRDAVLTLSSGTWLPQGKPIEAFKLTDANNQPFDNSSFKNKWTLIFFGFTNCPQLCPTTLSILNQTYQKLQHDQVNLLPQMLFISVDPERDTPAKIKNYLASFNAAFIGATADQVQITALTKQFNVVYAKIMASSDKHYTVDHSGTIMLINPEGQLQAIFSTPHDANGIASDYEKIITNQK